MAGFSRLVLLLTLSTIHAQDPRRRIFNQIMARSEDLPQGRNEDEGIICTDRNCLSKRSGQEESGPFWANRGKKDPNYIHEQLYADEPYWVLVRRDDRFQEEPFFISRGKKELASYSLRQRDRREFTDDVDSPFFAARGKRLKVKN